MIVYDLECMSGCPRFEGWFASSDAFEDQRARGLLICPHCGSPEVDKAVQAPRLARKGNQLSSRPAAAPRDDGPAPDEPLRTPVATGTLPQDVLALAKRLAEMQAATLKSSRYVGDGFAEQARAIHYGERDEEAIHGQATAAEANELAEEGIAVMPLPFSVLPPEQTN